MQQRTIDLNELNISLQQSNDDLQQFAHVASHDLKEPLRKIITFAGRLKDDEETTLSLKSETYLAKIKSATNRMVDMVEGVLTYSMYNAPEQKIEIINLHQTLKNIEEDLELLIQQKNAVIEYHSLPEIEGVSVLIYQLFYNLINNALKFSVTQRQPLIVISSKIISVSNIEYAEISVKDNGIGFDMEQGVKIFDPFARLNSKDKHEGTGLGLALCKKIAQRHGGSIFAKGEKNNGALFTVSLRLKQLKQFI